MMPSTRSRRLSLSAALLLGAALSACHKPTADKPPPAFTIDKDSVTLAPGAPRPVSFTTAKAELGAPLPALPITGRVTTVESLTAPTFAPLSGHVTEMLARLGDHVKKGDRLVKIKTGDISTLHHDLLAAYLAIKTKQAMADKTKILVDNHVAAQNDLLIAESELAEAKLAAANADSKIQALSVKPEDDTSYWIEAGRSGTVVEFNVTPGQEVGPDKDKPIATVADLDEVLIVGDLRPKDASSVAPGSEVSVTFAGAPGVTVRGTVETISEVIDPDRQTVPVRIRAKNAERILKPNAFVDITFKPSDKEQVLLVPSQAIVSDGAESVVFVETDNGPSGKRTFKRRPIEVRRQNKHMAEIKSGLEKGESVVTEGALLLLNSLDVEG